MSRISLHSEKDAIVHFQCALVFFFQITVSYLCMIFMLMNTLQNQDEFFKMYQFHLHRKKDHKQSFLSRMQMERAKLGG